MCKSVWENTIENNWLEKARKQKQTKTHEIVKLTLYFFLIKWQSIEKLICSFSN